VRIGEGEVVVVVVLGGGLVITWVCVDVWVVYSCLFVLLTFIMFNGSEGSNWDEKRDWYEKMN